MLWYGHVLSMNKERIPKKFLNIKPNKNAQEGNKDQDENWIRQMSPRRKEEHGMKLRRSCGKTEIDEKA
jgi:hypothetical protein